MTADRALACALTALTVLAAYLTGIILGAVIR